MTDFGSLEPTMTMSAEFTDAPTEKLFEDENNQPRNFRPIQRRRVVNFFDKYEVDETKFLGSGAFGKVYTVRIKDSYIEYVRENDIEEYESLPRYKGEIIRIYAAKVMDATPQNRTELALSMAISRYPHCTDGIVCMYEAFTDVFDSRTQTLKIVIVSELLKGESLDHYVENKEKIPTNNLRWLMFECLKALQNLHDIGYVHRDIKPANIMRVYKAVKIIDLGTCCSIKDASKTPCKLNQYNGTLYFMAPELQRARVGTVTTDRFDMVKADNYALGLTFKTLTGESGNVLRYEGEGASQRGIMKDEGYVMDRIMQLNYPEDIKRVIAGLNRYDPDERMTLEECIRILD